MQIVVFGIVCKPRDFVQIILAVNYSQFHGQAMS